MTGDHDLDLGNTLRAQPTPEHRPGFWDELEERLALEAPRPDRRRHRGSPSSHRRRYPGLAVLAVAAAVTLVVAAVTVIFPEGERDETRVSTDPPTTVPAGPVPHYRPGPERALGEGVVAGVSADGSAALLVADDPEAGTTGCEATRAKTLFAAPLDGGERRRTVPGDDPVAGTVLRNLTDPTQVAIVSVCEEFLSDLVVATEGRAEPSPTWSASIATFSAALSGGSTGPGTARPCSAWRRARGMSCGWTRPAAPARRSRPAWVHSWASWPRAPSPCSPATSASAWATSCTRWRQSASRCRPTGPRWPRSVTVARRPGPHLHPGGARRRHRRDGHGRRAGGGRALRVRDALMTRGGIEFHHYAANDMRR